MDKKKDLVYLITIYFPGFFIYFESRLVLLFMLFF